MTRLIAAEFLKLRTTRTFFAFLIACAVLVLVPTILICAFADLRRGPDRAAAVLHRLAHPDVLAADRHPRRHDRVPPRHDHAEPARRPQPDPADDVQADRRDADRLGDRARLDRADRRHRRRVRLGARLPHRRDRAREPDHRRHARVRRSTRPSASASARSCATRSARSSARSSTCSCSSRSRAGCCRSATRSTASCPSTASAPSRRGSRASSPDTEVLLEPVPGGPAAHALRRDLHRRRPAACCADGTSRRDHAAPRHARPTRRARRRSRSRSTSPRWGSPTTRSRTCWRSGASRGSSSPLDSAVAEDAQGTVIGFAHFRSGDLVVAVDPLRQGEGAGTALLDWAERRGPERGETRLRQAVGDRATTARALLEARGFGVARSYYRLERDLADVDGEPDFRGLAPERRAVRDLRRRLQPYPRLRVPRRGDLDPAQPPRPQPGPRRPRAWPRAEGSRSSAGSSTTWRTSSCSPCTRTTRARVSAARC